MRTHRIALYPGDGIGPEVVDATVPVLEALARLDGGFTCAWTRFDWGVDHHARHGVVAPDDLLEQLQPFDAILLGAVGWPAALPDSLTLAPLIRIRQSFDLWACVRPARTWAGVPSLLRSTAPIDLVVIRENAEGEYVDVGGRFHRGRPEEFAVQSGLHTRRGIERALRFGFDLARTRRHRLTLATKSNAQRHAFELWDEVLADLTPHYPDVESDKQHIDAIAMNFVRRPETFDVVVASNLFGDILTDLSGAITGGLGLNPSANLDPSRSRPSLFEPVHGSAPDIAGRGIANPVGTLLAGAMMLEWLGEGDAAARLRRAVEATLGGGHATPDIGGLLTTTQMAEAVTAAL